MPCPRNAWACCILARHFPPRGATTATFTGSRYPLAAIPPHGLSRPWSPDSMPTRCNAGPFMPMPTRCNACPFMPYAILCLIGCIGRLGNDPEIAIAGVSFIWRLSFFRKLGGNFHFMPITVAGHFGVAMSVNNNHETLCVIAMGDSRRVQPPLADYVILRNLT